MPYGSITFPYAISHKYFSTLFLKSPKSTNFKSPVSKLFYPTIKKLTIFITVRFFLGFNATTPIIWAYCFLSFWINYFIFPAAVPFSHLSLFFKSVQLICPSPVVLSDPRSSLFHNFRHIVDCLLLLCCKTRTLAIQAMVQCCCVLVLQCRILHQTLQLQNSDKLKLLIHVNILKHFWEAKVTLSKVLLVFLQLPQRRHKPSHLMSGILSLVQSWSWSSMCVWSKMIHQVHKSINNDMVNEFLFTYNLL